MNGINSSITPDQKNGNEFPKTVGIIFSDVKREYFPTEAQYITERGAKEDVEAIGKYLNTLNIDVNLYPGDANLTEKLKKHKPDMVINLVDSVKGYEYLSSAIPGILEMLEIPYTGADILGKSLDTNKFLIKKILQQNGIPIPDYQLINNYTDPIDPELKYPLISKLNEIHGAVEITQESVSDNEKHLRERLKYLIQTYKQPVLIEEFIVGREITAILFEGLNKKVYLAEKIFNDQERKYIFVTFKDQWGEGEKPTFHYEKYSDAVLREYVKKAFDVTKMYDYAKFDIRIDQSGRYYFIDTNCNPAFGPKEQEVALSMVLDLYGITFADILKRLMINTMNDAKGKELLPYPQPLENRSQKM